MCRKIYIGNLPYEMTEGHIDELLSGSGTVTEVRLARDASTGASKGFAFVTFATEEEAANAIQNFNNYEFSGRKLRLDQARKPAR